MAQNKDPRPKKIRPKERGEKWLLVDNRHVIVLERVRNGFVRCVTDNGFIVHFHENVFVKKESPQ